jgi:hypothetical protein
LAALITGILGMGGPGSAWSVHRIVVIAIILQTTGGEREKEDRGGEGCEKEERDKTEGSRGCSDENEQ